MIAGVVLEGAPHPAGASVRAGGAGFKSSFASGELITRLRVTPWRVLNTHGIAA
ncbi:MAG: hypothetical protein L6455_07770 [Kiritimatiellae bacterium]|nr:hypothetical protein [Kiritimatiellia bacterium]